MFDAPGDGPAVHATTADTQVLDQLQGELRSVIASYSAAERAEVAEALSRVQSGEATVDQVKSGSAAVRRLLELLPQSGTDVMVWIGAILGILAFFGVNPKGSSTHGPTVNIVQNLAPSTSHKAPHISDREQHRHRTQVAKQNARKKHRR